MQGELFEISGPVVDASRISRTQAGWMSHFRVTLRFDHLLTAGISALVLYVLVFSFGVEKGKRYAQEELKAEKAKRENITRELVQPQAESEATPLLPEKKPNPQKELPPQPPAVNEISAGHYTIQLVTFTSRQLAEEKVDRLKRMGYPSFIIPQGKFFQVCVDAFKNVSEARQNLTRLRAKGFAPSDAFVRPVSHPLV